MQTDTTHISLCSLIKAFTAEYTLRRLSNIHADWKTIRIIMLNRAKNSRLDKTILLQNIQMHLLDFICNLKLSNRWREHDYADAFYILN